jgi:signal transduction histidine kinase
MGMALEATMQRLLAAKTPQPLSRSPRGGNGALLPCAEAYAALKHLHMIVNRSQDYARILAGLPLKPNPQAVDVAKTVRAVVQWKAITADVPVVIEPPPPGFVATGVTDASWLQDNLLCVIDNACKVTQRGSGVVSVCVRTVVVAGRKLLEINVKDLGDEALSDVQVRTLHVA